MTNTDQHEDKDRLRSVYLQTAFHYYITARFATINALVPIAGNLAHHAIEMFLKAALVETTTEKERIALGHNLQRIWQQYKTLTWNAALDKFDQTITDLDKFEDIRYPERTIRYGMTLEAGLVRNLSSIKRTQPEPRYELALEELDELVKLIFQTSGINPEFFTQSAMKSDALRYLNEQNQTPLI
jgi:hypothetical protein